MSIDEMTFRQAMSRFASGVTVVTTRYQDRLYGITVSSFCSLSLEPRLVLICIEKTTPSHQGISGAGFFAVNILARDQEAISRRFAAPLTNKFDGMSYHFGQTGAPILEGCLANIECRITEALPGGDHTIFVGEVLTATIHEGEPLLYYRSSYHHLGT
ncbi:MAG: flavin reductase [Herpetosiphonaceae bacterium]|nr:MAG: flavin reductase [Herpetosiphonaceae bacterium]